MNALAPSPAGSRRRPDREEHPRTCPLKCGGLRPTSHRNPEPGCRKCGVGLDSCMTARKKARQTKGAAAMRYILMMNTMRAGHGVPQWSQQELQAHIAFMLGLNKE